MMPKQISFILFFLIFHLPAAIAQVKLPRLIRDSMIICLSALAASGKKAIATVI